MKLTESEKNRIRGLHKDFSVIQEQPQVLTEGIKCFDFATLTGLGDRGCTGGQSCEGNEILDENGNGTAEWEYCCGGCDDWGPGSVTNDGGEDEWLGDGPVRGTAAVGGKDYGDSMSALDTQALNEQNNIQLYQAAAAGDAQALCKLCNMSYLSSSQRNKYCRCSTCTCSTGQIDNNLLCKLCNIQYWNTSDRNKRCRCSTCICSNRHGEPTTTNLGVDKNFRGPSEFDGGNVQTESHLNRVIKRVINEDRRLLTENIACEATPTGDDCAVGTCLWDPGTNEMCCMKHAADGTNQGCIDGYVQNDDWIEQWHDESKSIHSEPCECPGGGGRPKRCGGTGCYSDNPNGQLGRTTGPMGGRGPFTDTVR